MGDDNSEQEGGVSIPSDRLHETTGGTERGETQRITFRGSKALVAEIDKLVAAGVFQNRSEAYREGMRRVVFADYEPVSGQLEVDHE